MMQRYSGFLRLGEVVTLVAFFSACPKSCASGPDADPATTYIPRFERILTQNIVPFCYEKNPGRAC